MTARAQCTAPLQYGNAVPAGAGRAGRPEPRGAGCGRQDAARQRAPGAAPDPEGVQAGRESGSGLAGGRGPAEPSEGGRGRAAQEMEAERRQAQALLDAERVGTARPKAVKPERGSLGTGNRGGDVVGAGQACARSGAGPGLWAVGLGGSPPPSMRLVPGEQMKLPCASQRGPGALGPSSFGTLQLLVFRAPIPVRRPHGSPWHAPSPAPRHSRRTVSSGSPQPAEWLEALWEIHLNLPPLLSTLGLCPRKSVPRAHRHPPGCPGARERGGVPGRQSPGSGLTPGPRVTRVRSHGWASSVESVLGGVLEGPGQPRAMANVGSKEGTRQARAV